MENPFAAANVVAVSSFQAEYAKHSYVPARYAFDTVQYTELHEPYSKSKLTDKGDTQMTSTMREAMEVTPNTSAVVILQGPGGRFEKKNVANVVSV